MTPFGGTFTPAAVRWWLFFAEDAVQLPGGETARLSHYDALLGLVQGSRAPEELEALEHCFGRVVHDGARDPYHGWPCVCLRETASAAEARGRHVPDGMSCKWLQIDFERAIDQLPLPWTSTQRLYDATRRKALWQARMRPYWRGHAARAYDRDPEPTNPQDGRPQSMQLAYAIVAFELGWRGERAACSWPRRALQPLHMQIISASSPACAA